MKKDSTLGKSKVGDKIIAKVKAEYFDEDSIKTQTWQYTNIMLGGKEIKALIDSAADMPIINSNVIPPSFKNKERSKVQLMSAFGETVVANL